MEGRERPHTDTKKLRMVGIATASVCVRHFRFGTSYNFRRLFLLHRAYIKKKSVLGKGMCFTRNVGVSFGGLFSDAFS